MCTFEYFELRLGVVHWDYKVISVLGSFSEVCQYFVNTEFAIWRDRFSSMIQSLIP